MAGTPARDTDTLEAGRAPTGTDPGDIITVNVFFSTAVKK